MSEQRESINRRSWCGVRSTCHWTGQTVIVMASIVAALGSESLGIEATPATRGQPPLHIDFQDQVEVRMVMVPVSVLDRRRRPVLDLARSDFEILVDGEAVPILTFEPAGAQLLPALAAVGAEAVVENPATGGRTQIGRESSLVPAGPPSPGSHVAVVIDVYQTRLTRAALAFEAVRNMLENGVPKSSRVGLFIVKHGRLETLMPFTQDNNALLEALDVAYTDVGNRDLWITEEPARGIYASEDDCARIRQLSTAQAMRVRNVLASLRGLSAAMESLAGRKGVVLLTDGLRMRSGTNYALGGRNPIGFWLKAHCSVSVQPEMARLVRELGDAGISLSPISMLGLTFPDPNNHFSDEDSELLGTGSFLAEETGGRRPVQANNFEQEVVAAVTQPLHRYLLGFRPPEPGPDGKKHRIVVRVHRARVEVAARAQYVDGPVDPTGERLVVGAAIFPERFQDIPMVGQVRVLSAGEGRQELHVQMTLDTSSLVWIPFDEKHARGELQISALLDDDQGNQRELFDSYYTITVSRDAPPARLILQEAVPLELALTSRMVVVAHDTVAGRVGAWESEVQPTEAAGRSQRTQVRVTAPVLMQSDPASYLLTPTGEPLLGRRLGSTVFVPVERAGAERRLRLAMVRVENLPAGGSVRLCLDAEGEVGCVQAALESIAMPPTDRQFSQASKKGKRVLELVRDYDAVLVGWIALKPSGDVPASIRVEVLDADGQVQAQTMQRVGTGGDGELSGHASIGLHAGFNSAMVN